MLCFRITKGYGSYLVEIDKLKDTIECEMDLMDEWTEGDSLLVEMVDVDEFRNNFDEE